MTGHIEILKKLEELRPKEETLEEIVDIDVTSKSIICLFLKNTNSINESAEIKIQAVIDRTFEKINIGNWQDVPSCLRKTMTIISYLRLLALIKCSKNEDTTKESFKIIDFGIMFGNQLDAAPQLLQKCASIITFLNTTNIDTMDIAQEETTPPADFKQPNTVTIEVIDCPSMESFYKNYILKAKPVVLTNCMNHWPALSKWKDHNYLVKLAGFRTVPVELGNKYTDLNWTQMVMTIEEFVKLYICETSSKKGYLAQYQLFDQIPELKQDIVEPEYCCFSEKNDPTDINAWYGPKGTVSPLHHDPKKNLLAQVVGEKQIILYSPLDSDYLYPHDHEFLNNTSQVDPSKPDFEKYPKFKEAKAHYCILKPGQMLYIPPKWWHFVESLSISFSVSFWWE